MNSRSAKGLVKHADFILLDMIFLQVAFVIAFWIFHEFSNPYDDEPYKFQAVVLMTSQLLVIVLGNAYSGIIRRGKLDELIEVIKHIGYTLVIALVSVLVELGNQSSYHEDSVLERLAEGIAAGIEAYDFRASGDQNPKSPDD